MAISSLTRKSSSHHSRSNSSPMELHPYVSQFNEHLYRIKSSEDTSSSSSSSTIRHMLTGLKQLYSVSIDDLLHSISAQQSLSAEQNSATVEAALDGTLRLLDLCTIAEDVMTQAKESMGQLQLALRRRFCEHVIAKSVIMYMESRKKIKKIVAKSLKDTMKKTTSVNEKLQDASIGQFLEESESISFKVLASLLSYIAGPKAVSRTSKRWFVGAKKENGVQMTKFEVVDDGLHVLLNHRSVKCVSDPDKLKCQLAELETIVLDLQERLGCLSRQLIKARVTLLNILNH